MSRIAFLLILVAAIGCSSSPPAASVAADAGAVAEPGPPATSMAGALAAVGLDVAALPPLGETTEAQRDAVMETFTRALGVGCGECHDDDYTAETPNVRIARRMWDHFVRGLARGDGGALYCDSCHAGRATFLDRSDARVDGALGRFMQATYVGPLVRRDGAPHDCATCHGTPFVGGFLDDWAAPDDLPDAGGPADLGAPPDLAPSVDLGGGDLGVVGCEALLVCLDACAAGDGACTGACKRHASAAAKALLTAAQACANSACIVAGRCRSASDDSPACDACFSNASAGGGTGAACVPPDDPICGACAAEWLACESS